MPKGDETTTRFEETEKRYAALEKRFDDIKWYFGGAASLFTLWFGVLTVVFSSNFNSQKEDLRDFKNNLRADLGKLELPADIEMLSVRRSPLAGQDLLAEIDLTKPNEPYLDIDFILHNQGDGDTGPMYVKIYTKDPLRLNHSSSDEPDFQYEEMVTPSRLDPPQMPGKLSIQSSLQFAMHGPLDAASIKSRRSPALVKVYYGKGKVVRADVILVIK
jgi:hypothetical protein